jgi:hypothetical protein
MHWLKVTACLSFVALLLGTFVTAQLETSAVADKYIVSFSDPFRVGDALLPEGDYEIQHTMNGEEHIMVFRQLQTTKPIEVRAKCTLVPLPEKARHMQKAYILNAANERVLHELVFKGDNVKHVF